MRLSCRLATTAMAPIFLVMPLPSPNCAVAGGAVDGETLLAALEQLGGDPAADYLDEVGRAR